jgi:hypothetical protein
MHHEPAPLPRSAQDTFPEVADTELDALFRTLAAQTLDEPQGLHTTLRELPTPRRRALAVLGMAVVFVVVVFAHGTRADLSGEALLRFLLSIGALVAVSVGAASITLRSAHERPLPSWSGGLGVAALLLPALVSLLPGWWPGFEVGALPMAVHLGCGAAGLAAAVGAAGAILVFDRDDLSTRARIVSAAAAGGLIGYTTQAVSCPVINLDHLVLSHASQGVLVWALLIAWTALRRAVSR